jgi:leucyl-tRNA synthetase
MELAVQVNGKLRSKIQANRGISEEELKEMVLRDAKLFPGWKEKLLKRSLLFRRNLSI